MREREFAKLFSRSIYIQADMMCIYSCSCLRNSAPFDAECALHGADSAVRPYSSRISFEESELWDVKFGERINEQPINVLL
jgi:hypothetical protein